MVGEINLWGQFRQHSMSNFYTSRFFLIFLAYGVNCRVEGVKVGRNF